MHSKRACSRKGQPPLGLFKILRVAFMSLSKEAIALQMSSSLNCARCRTSCHDIRIPTIVV
eukprot:6192340-Amphidinium_carterae.1